MGIRGLARQVRVLPTGWNLPKLGGIIQTKALIMSELYPIWLYLHLFYC